MKNIRIIFKLLLFPFLFLMRFLSHQNSNIHFQPRVLTSDKHVNRSFFFSLHKLLLSIFFTLALNFSFSNAAFYDINDDDNDAEERISDGDMSRGSNDLDMAYDPDDNPDRGLQIVGLKFNSVSIPIGATITSAKIHFRSDGSNSGTTSLIIRGELANNAVDFSNNDYDLSSRTRTSASMTWNPSAWSNNTDYETNDISNIIQEIVNQAGYAGDGLVIFIEPGAGCTGSSCRRKADSRDESNSAAPRLEVEYTLADTPPIMGDVPNQSTEINGVFPTLDISTYVTLTDSDPITAYTLSGTLPTGLIFNSSTGLLSGTPTQSGTFNLSITATDNDGVSNSDSFTITVLPETPPIMGDVPNQIASIGSVFPTLDISNYVTLTNGDPITAYTLTGALPTGLIFNSSTGLLSGTPTQVGLFNLSVTATDNDGVSNSDSFSITVGCNGSYDASDAADSPPGTVITTMHGITTDIYTCINGSSPNGDSDYYYFTVGAGGILNITTSSPDSSDYHLEIGSSSGGNDYYPDTTAQSHNVDEISLSSGDSVYIYVKETGSNTDEYQINFDFQVIAPAPPVMGDIPDQNLELGTPLTLSLASYVAEPNGDPITYTLTGTLPAGLSFDSSTGIISGAPTALGSFNLSATATDKDGTSNADAFTITVTPPSAPNANDNSYTAPINTTVSDNVLTNDTGYNITVTANTVPSNGTLTISADGSFTYMPTLNFAGIDTFEYTITDAYDRNDTALVTITITNETDFDEGIQDFILINPPATRNMIGNYAILGNTVECITEKRGTDGESNSFNGTCQNSTAYNDNNYMAKYIDIDGSTGIGATTWNSTSSNFTLPNSYSQENGRGIAWAGLFWQGSINNDESYAQRRAYLDNGTIQYKYITSDQNINLETTAGNQVLIRIDNDTTYTPLQASTFYYDRAHGDRGGYYAAYTDITYLLQNKNLAEGKHTITVANITANEGRQQGTGNYAGWSIVVIYKEAGDDAKARNISIYNGYTQVSNGSNTPPLEISGFKLPDSGEVNAQFAAFAGEGEYIYGDGTEYDRMVMGRTLAQVTGTNPDTMPGAIDPDNIFDAILANIDRDAGNNNEMTGNNNGIDIENYDVSDIMTDYRDIDPNIDTIHIGLSSSQDYITPSMLSFSAELYKPNVCYDYVVRRDEYTIPSDGRLIDAFMNPNDNLSITVAVRSLESDFELTGTKVAVIMSDTNGSAIFDSAEYSPTTSNILLPTVTTSTSTLYRPEIAVGKDRDPLTGGTIGSYERYYAKYNYDVAALVGGKFQTKFNIELNTTIDFGSGPVSQLLPLSRCEQTPIYSPVWGQFNVERNFASVPPVSEPTARYSLYTQIAGKDFDYSVAHYDNSDPVNPQSISDATVDVELIDATAFDDNTSFLKCSNTDPSIIIGGLHNSTFVKFGSTAVDRVSITDTSDLVDVPALRSAVFRMWTLLDENGTLIAHTNDKIDGDKFRAIYDEHYKDKLDLANPKLCGTACNATNGVANNSSCYECLRIYFATPNCSRDNFSVRPESYRISLNDIGADGENSSTPLGITTNDSTMSKKSLAAEYNYKMTGVSTKFGGTATAERYYNENFLTATPDMIISPNVSNDVIALEFTGPTACQDTNHSTVNLTFSNGSIDDYNLSHDNAGDYNLWIEDNQWTKVDQADFNPYKTIFDPNCRAASITDTVNASCSDCILGDNRSNHDPKAGCQTDSSIVGNTDYNDVELEFEPYRFDLSAITFRTAPNDNGTHLYMGDLNNSLVMAAKLEGNITAEGKEGTVLTNFTDGCAAEDVILWLDRTMTPQENTIQSIDPLSGITTGNPVLFQQVLQDIYDINTFSIDNNSTLQKDNFANSTDNNGSAEVDLYFNFEKPYAELVNPIDVNFSMLNAVSPNALSNANMVSDYIPDGNRTIAQQRYFYFAKVSPPDGVDGAETYEVLVSTILKVNTFCRDDLNITCSLLPGLPPVPENVFTAGGWYRMENHLSSSGDGQIDTLSTTVPGVGITPSSNVTFDTNGSTANIDITYPLAGRPVHPVIVIDPDEWLKYNPDVSKNGLPEFTIHFLNQGLKWKGEGQTGHVVDTEPSTGTSQRINW